MPALFLVGRRPNLLARAQSVTATDSKTDFPPSYLYDGRPGRPWWANTVGTKTIDVRNQLYANPSWDTWSGGLPTSWTKEGAGTVTEETVDRAVASGSALKIDATAGAVSVYQDVVVRAGEWLRWLVHMKAISGATARFYVRNRENGLYLQPGLTWAATANELFSEAGAAYVAKSASAQVQSYGVLRKDEVPIRVTCFQLAGVGLYDEGFFIPGVNFMSVLGHNLPAMIAASLDSSDDNSTWSGTSVTIYDPSFYRYEAGGALQYHQYWRLTMTDSNTLLVTPVGLGDLVLGQASALTASPAHPAHTPWTMAYDRAQVRQESDAGDAYAFNRGSARRRVLGIPYEALVEAEMLELVDEIRNRCEDGVHPMVVVPRSDARHVIHGRIDKSFEARQVMRTDSLGWYHDHDLIIRESAFPNFAA